MNTPSGKAIAPKAMVMSHWRPVRDVVLVNSAPNSTIKYYFGTVPGTVPGTVRTDESCATREKVTKNSFLDGRTDRWMDCGTARTGQNFKEGEGHDEIHERMDRWMDGEGRRGMN